MNLFCIFAHLLGNYIEIVKIRILWILIESALNQMKDHCNVFSIFEW